MDRYSLEAVGEKGFGEEESLKASIFFSFMGLSKLGLQRGEYCSVERTGGYGSVWGFGGPGMVSGFGFCSEGASFQKWGRVPIDACALKRCNNEASLLGKRRETSILGCCHLVPVFSSCLFSISYLIICFLKAFLSQELVPRDALGYRINATEQTDSFEREPSYMLLDQ